MKRNPEQTQYIPVRIPKPIVAIIDKEIREDARRHIRTSRSAIINKALGQYAQRRQKRRG